jgi:hypothetical protein
MAAHATKAAQYADRDVRCAGTTMAGPLYRNELPMVGGRNYLGMVGDITPEF